MSVSVKTYSSPLVSKKEILRYAGGDFSDMAEKLLDSALDEVSGRLSFKVCYKVFSATYDGDKVTLGGFCFSSRSLAKNLDGAARVLVFAASVGVELDRLILKYSRLSPARALVLQAIGAERVEALADEFLKDFSEENGVFLKPRFSVGYGDFDLALQKDVFALLAPEKNIGVYLSDSLIMTPTKSITAFVGIKEANE